MNLLYKRFIYILNLLIQGENKDGLKRHAEEEMKYLAALLPPLYGSQDID